MDVIAQEVRDKIFQPFFSRTPARQGIGLGLSLAQDGGLLRCGTRTAEYAGLT